VKAFERTAFLCQVGVSFRGGGCKGSKGSLEVTCAKVAFHSLRRALRVIGCSGQRLIVVVVHVPVMETPGFAAVVTIVAIISQRPQGIDAVAGT
jgi:hypothetical protein